MKAGVLLTLFILTHTLRISWRNWVIGIALGLGVEACFDLAGSALRDYFGNSSLITVDVVETIGFHICVVIWLVYAPFFQRTSLRRVGALESVTSRPGIRSWRGWSGIDVRRVRWSEISPIDDNCIEIVLVATTQAFTYLNRKLQAIDSR